MQIWLLAGHDVSGGHAAAITSDGSLWVWGGNTQGQLGLGEQSETWVSSPRKVSQLGRDATPAPAAAVACGSSHTAVLLADGSLWVAGCNHLGCCGLPETVQEVSLAPPADQHHRFTPLTALPSVAHPWQRGSAKSCPLSLW